MTYPYKNQADPEELDFNRPSWVAPEDDTKAYFDNDELVSDTVWFDEVFSFEAPDEKELRLDTLALQSRA
jgi:hypothetical protein